MSAFRLFAPRLQQAITARLGWTALRPVQNQAAYALLDGKNAVILAPTAGGKTEAAMFPVLSKLVCEPPLGLTTLYIAPIKALLNNQAERLGLYTQMVGLDRFVWHGDVGSAARKRFLREPCCLLMTTPESLEVMLVSKSVDESRLFNDLRFVVIDEIHALAGSDRGAHLLSVIERLSNLSRHDVQRVGLSATVGNPADILGWIQGTSERDAVVINPPTAPAPKELLVIHRESLGEIARDASKMAKGTKSLFFCQSRKLTETVADRMAARGVTVFVHHSAVSKEERELAEAQFHHGGDACIVCTSTLELGIDVGDLDRVLQAETPSTVSAFMQRMGRTGRRAGRNANTTFFCSSPETVLVAVAILELARAGFVESVRLNDRCWPVLVHQLFTMALACDGITPDDAWGHLSRLPDFSGITKAEFDRLLRWMIEHRALEKTSGLLVIGHAAERKFGRRNFMEMYAVFSSPRAYAVLVDKQRPVGTLEQDFVDRLVEGASTFLLGGRGWAVVAIDHKRRRIQVVPASSGTEPTWSGFLPQYLSFEICQQVQDFVGSDRLPPWLHTTAAEIVEAERASLQRRDLLPFESPSLELQEEALVWWTYAGGKINNTLRYAIRACEPDWKVTPDNYSVRIKGEGASRPRVGALIERFSDPEFWANRQLWQEIAEDLPNYRLSKFQPFMPAWVAREMVAGFLLDIEGAWSFLGGSEVQIPTSATAQLLQIPAGTSSPQLGGPLPGPQPSAVAQTRNPIHWIGDVESLRDVCAGLAHEPRIGLDVETTLRDRRLCLVQLANETDTWLIDPLSINDLSPLATLMADPNVVKIIHNASFEKSVLGQHGMTITPILDTLKQSRDIRGRKLEGGHALAVVCGRELGAPLDKGEQTSDWRRRPLTKAQIEYAALDAEILLRVADALG